MAATTTSCDRVSSLPVELRLSILAFIPDPRSLASASVACRSLRTAFRRDRDGLVRSSLVQCVGFDVLPEATVVHRCIPAGLSRYFRAEINPISVGDVLNQYILEYFDRLERPVITDTTWTLREAIDIADFHTHTVSSLVHKFIQFCSQSSHVPMQDSFASLPPTATERDRIARAFYRFELFRKLYSCFQQRPMSLFDCSPAFFLRFAPWEHTQLGCIHDFLGRQLSPIFNQVARIDYEWTSRHNVPFNTNLHNPYIQHLLSMGLKWIHELVTMTSVAEFRPVLCADAHPRWNDFFLEHVLRDMLDDHYNPDHSQLEEFERSKAFFKDADPGPELIWQLSRTESMVAAYAPRNWQHRQWGYALWDLERLQFLGALDWPWQPAPYPEQFSDEVTLEDIKQSWSASLEAGA